MPHPGCSSVKGGSFVVPWSNRCCSRSVGWQLAGFSGVTLDPHPISSTSCGCNCHCICECWQSSLIWLGVLLVTSLVSLLGVGFYLLTQKGFSAVNPPVDSPVKGRKGAFGQQGKTLTLTS